MINISRETGDIGSARQCERLLKALETNKVGRNDPLRKRQEVQKVLRACGNCFLKAFVQCFIERDLLTHKQQIDGKNFASDE